MSEQTSTKVVHVSGEVEISETAIDVNGRYLFLFEGIDHYTGELINEALKKVMAGEQLKESVGVPTGAKLHIYPIIEPSPPTLKDITQEQWDRAKESWQANKWQGTAIVNVTPYLEAARINLPDLSSLLIDLEHIVQSNQEFFGNPSKYFHPLEVALGKLAQLIEESRGVPGKGVTQEQINQAAINPFLAVCAAAERDMADKIERLVASRADVFGKPKRVKAGGLLELALNKLTQLTEETVRP